MFIRERENLTVLLHLSEGTTGEGERGKQNVRMFEDNKIQLTISG
jgi:hypothetical protein